MHVSVAVPFLCDSIIAAAENTPRSAQHQFLPHEMPKSVPMGQKMGPRKGAVIL